MQEVGEKAFLKSLLPGLKVDSNFVNGFGHDASVIDIGFDQCIAFKIDRAPFPVALRHDIGNYRTWGRLAVATNISDLLAVGAKPRAVMLSLVLPSDFDVSNARDIVIGCEEACARHDVVFLGGDTKEGSVAQVVGAALGTIEKDAIFGRMPAMPGDYLVLAGRLGAFTGTLSLLETHSPEDHIPQDWVDTLTSPIARIQEGAYLRAYLQVIAACDLSDGLAEAIQIFCAEGTGITLSETRLPMHQLAVQASNKCSVPLWRYAFGVGDWAIACVVRDTDTTAIQNAAKNGLELFVIGQFDETGKQCIIDKDGINRDFPKLINEQFRIRVEDQGNYLEYLLRTT